MKTIPAGQFKARCLRLMDEVRETREPAHQEGPTRSEVGAGGEPTRGYLRLSKGQDKDRGDENIRKSPLLKTIW
jgi:hypothetical protein